MLFWALLSNEHGFEITFCRRCVDFVRLEFCFFFKLVTQNYDAQIILLACQLYQGLLLVVQLRENILDLFSPHFIDLGPVLFEIHFWLVYRRQYFHEVFTGYYVNLRVSRLWFQCVRVRSISKRVSFPKYLTRSYDS